MITAEKFNEQIAKYVEDEFQGDFKEFIYANDEPFNVEGLGLLTFVIDGRDDEYWEVVAKLDSDQYFRILGQYDSWEGVEWSWSYNEFIEVWPKTVTIIDYVSRKPE